jgi:hypothetical protein
MKRFVTWMLAGFLALFFTGCASTQHAARGGSHAPQLAMDEVDADHVGWTVRPISDRP